MISENLVVLMILGGELLFFIAKETITSRHIIANHIMVVNTPMVLLFLSFYGIITMICSRANNVVSLGCY